VPKLTPFELDRTNAVAAGNDAEAVSVLPFVPNVTLLELLNT
jgi:hypothetical protein